MTKSFLPIILTGVLIATGAFLIVVQKSNHHLNDELSLSNLKAASMVADQQALRDRIFYLKSQTDSLSSTRDDLEGSLIDSKSMLSDQEHRIAKLIAAFKELNKKYDDVLDRQKQRFKKLADLTSINARLVSENKNLNVKLAGLNEANQQLVAELSMAKGLEKDNIFIEPVDEDDKPCAIGSRVKKIVATLSLPDEIKSPVFKIFDPEGKPLPVQAGQFTFNSSKEGSQQKMTKLELTYLPKKIGSGLYRVEIASEGRHVGNLLMKFR